jgi:hypothetical protein
MTAIKIVVIEMHHDLALARTAQNIPLGADRHRAWRVHVGDALIVDHIKNWCALWAAVVHKPLEILK